MGKKKVICHYEKQISIINWELELSGRKERERGKKNPHFSHFSCVGFIAPRIPNTPDGFKNTDLSSPLRVQDKVYLSFASNLVLHVAVLPGALPCVYLLLH